MSAGITVAQLEQWLGDGEELALFDVREDGEYGEGHLFLAVPLPFSRLETDVRRLAPGLHTRVVVYDDGISGVAKAAARQLVVLGYQQVFELTGGAPAWSEAGYSLFEGVNLPSKTFGEHVEIVKATPHISAPALQALIEQKAPLLILDGRPFAEYQKMSIPGSICCPNGELSTRFELLAPDDKTPVVVNCAGRTRSIIGAQTLIELGVKNPVYALENGTQGWMLADLTLEKGKQQRYPDAPAPLSSMAEQAQRLAQKGGVEWVDVAQVNQWIAENHTVYLLDVRSIEEFAAGSVAGVQHAPGGQLQQATDHYVGVRNARLVLLDSENVRAPVTAYWLRQMGHRACVLQGGIEAVHEVKWPHIANSPVAPPIPLIPAEQLHQWLTEGRLLHLWDIRSSQRYRDGHIAGSEWMIRPHLMRAAQTFHTGQVIIISDTEEAAAWAATALGEKVEVWTLHDGFEAWQKSGYEIVKTPAFPDDADRIDFLFFTHDRHQGNKDAARQYLAWEQGLWARLQPSEQAIFKVVKN